MGLPCRTRYVLLLSMIWFLVPITTGVVVNRTIDDTYGDSENGKKVTYLPATNVWDSPNCARCVIKPDTSQAFKNTYMAATHDPGDDPISIEMEFEGIAIWVYFINANDAGAGVTTLTNVNFTLDGGTPIPYQHIPDLTTKDIQYNQLAFSQTNLANVKHRLIISVAENGNSFVNFDYAIYTHDDDRVLDPSSSLGGLPVSSTSASTKSTSITSTKTQTSSSATSSGEQNNKGATSVTGIVGGVIGGIAAAVLLFFLVMCLMRSRRRRLGLEEKDWNTQDPVVTPFYHPYAGLTSNSNTNHSNLASYPSPAQQNVLPLPQSEPTYGAHASVLVTSNSVGGFPESTQHKSASVTQGGGDMMAGEVNMEEMKGQREVMTSEVVYLGNRQQSTLDLGLPDDPPGYQHIASSPPPQWQQLQLHS